MAVLVHVDEWFSPHAWGWTDGRRRRSPGRAVFPTRVGMDRLRKAHASRSLRFPHTRGDGPFQGNGEEIPHSFSPHAWGWTGVYGAHQRAPIVFPTRVGMDRLFMNSGELNLCFPHTRGDGPISWRSRCQICPFSPHAWGWTDDWGGAAEKQAVFPTRVGMDRRRGIGHLGILRFPHTRGDGPVVEGAEELQRLFSPHAWGWTDRQHRPGLVVDVFPTRVGMDRGTLSRPRSPACFPHTRGDGPPPRASCCPTQSFSPHAWGWTADRPGVRQLQDVFPTRVGMDRARRWRRCKYPCFPHTRGDGPSSPSTASASLRFSPHAWGWTGALCGVVICQHVFPTRVGMDRCTR